MLMKTYCMALPHGSIHLVKGKVAYWYALWAIWTQRTWPSIRSIPRSVGDVHLVHDIGRNILGASHLIHYKTFIFLKVASLRKNKHKEGNPIQNMLPLFFFTLHWQYFSANRNLLCFVEGPPVINLKQTPFDRQWILCHDSEKWAVHVAFLSTVLFNNAGRY